jgi:hypothetical protein
MTKKINMNFRDGSTQSKVFALLEDKQWHCREHEGKAIASGQYAGGGGIQGLQRGSGQRLGLEIEQKSEFCPICNKKTRWDRWTGDTKTANFASSIPLKLAERILTEFNYIDEIEQRARAKHELVIDHRFPMERWGQGEESHLSDMTSKDIRAKFQLLKKDTSGNHNLLKSRACERCIATGKRGTPFGINYWYEGGEDWDESIPARGSETEKGCYGCGWYNFHEWRVSLNQKLKSELATVLQSSES